MATDRSASVDAAPDPAADGRRAVSFGVARRGYDQGQVDSVLQQMVTEVDGLRAIVTELREREADLLVALDAAEYRAEQAERRADDLAAEAAQARDAADRAATGGPAAGPDPASVADPGGVGADAGPAPEPIGDPTAPAAASGSTPLTDAGDLAAIVGEETVRIVEAARHAAVEIGARARDDAERVIAEAREEARLIRADAEVQLLHRTREADDAVAARLLEAAESVQEAQTRAEAIVADAFTEGATVVLRSREEAAAQVADGEARAEELLEAARTARDELLVDLVKRRKLLRTQVEQLEAGRARLRAAYEVVEGALAGATDELDRTVGEARDAAHAAAERAAAAPDPELDAAVTALGVDPVELRARVDPSSAPSPPAPETGDGSPVTAPGGSSASTVALSGVPAAPADGPAGESAAAPELTSDLEDPTSFDAPAAEAAPSAADAPSTGPAAVTVTVAVPSPAEDGPVDGDLGDPTAPATAAAPATTDDRAAGEASGGRTTDDPAADEPARDVPARGDEPTAPAGGTEPEIDLRTGSDGEVATPATAPGARRRRKRAPDPVEFEGRWSSAVRVLPPGPETAEPDAAPGAPRSTRRSRTGASASEVFARLRGVDPNQVSLFEQPAPEPVALPADDAAAAAPIAEDGDPEARWIERRDAAVAPALRALRRRLKATLADDEDSLLEALRRAEVVPTSIDAVRDARARRDDLVTALVPGLTTAVAAGADLAAADPSGPSGPSASTARAGVDVDALAGELADVIAEPLDERLERSLARYHRTIADVTADADGDAPADPEPQAAAFASLVSSIKAAYRARRGVQVQVPTEHAVLGAGHRGLVAALPAGTPLRWVVAAPASTPRRGATGRTGDGDDAADPTTARECPSCVAVADVGAGDRFGHGHLLPPARPGCRCAVAPVSAVVPRRA